MMYKYDLVYKTRFGYVFQLNNLVKRDKFDLDHAYTYLYPKFNFFNNIRVKKKVSFGFSSRFSVFHSFVYQCWYLVVIYDYMHYFSILCDKIIEDDYTIKKEDYPFYMEIKQIFDNLRDGTIIMSSLFYPLDALIKNPFLDTHLFNDFGILVGNNIIVFNLNYYLEFNEISLEEDLGITEDDLLKEFLLYSLIKKFNYNSKVFNIIVNDLLYESFMDLPELEFE
jgi:hypothetical protein